MDLKQFIIENKQRKKKIYIYGYSPLATQVRAFAEEEGAEISGYIVSEGYKVVTDENIYLLSELPQNVLDRISIIMTVKSYHFNEIIPELVHYGIDSIYFLTGAEEFKKMDHFNTFYKAPGVDTNIMYRAQEHFYQVALLIEKYITSFISPQSVVDFGCGAGTWLKAFKDQFPGIRVLGLDGSDVDRTKNLKPDEFEKVDFENFAWNREKYDLAISIEVAEHLDETRADSFIENICASSDMVLFAAAVKFQGGDHHINEQFPSYWMKKFSDNGFEYIDCIRPHFWNNPEIDMIYKENIILYVRKTIYESVLNRIPIAKNEFMDWIHPDLYEHKMELAYKGFIK